MTYCAVCHGVAARGDGPLADQLRVRPPDLTLIAKRSGGRFDDETVRRIIDGRKPVKGHGGPDMVTAEAVVMMAPAVEMRLRPRKKTRRRNDRARPLGSAMVRGFCVLVPRGASPPGRPDAPPR